MRVSIKKNAPLYIGLIALLSASLMRSTFLNDPSYQWVSTTGLSIFTVGLILQIVILEDMINDLREKVEREAADD